MRSRIPPHTRIPARSIGEAPVGWHFTFAIRVSSNGQPPKKIGETVDKIRRLPADVGFAQRKKEAKALSAL
jgi:hypothetical protein